MIALLKQAQSALITASNCVDGYYVPAGHCGIPEVEDAIKALDAAIANDRPRSLSELLCDLACDHGWGVFVRFGRCPADYYFEIQRNDLIEDEDNEVIIDGVIENDEEAELLVLFLAAAGEKRAIKALEKLGVKL